MPRPPLALALTALALLGLPASAPAQGKTVTATGTGEARIAQVKRPADPAALSEAKSKATVAAVADARVQGARLAQATGLKLGEITAVAESSPNPFAGVQALALPLLAPPLPGRPCAGRVLSAPRPPSRRRARRPPPAPPLPCGLPSVVVVQLSVTFAAT